jgi:histidyl-tRNA synthetase
VDPVKVIRGMRDIYPDQARWWHRLEGQLAKLLECYGYGEIRTPILEHTELFKRSIGEETDIVEKEMYCFDDRDGSSLSLRPEGTAAVIRSYIENSQWQKEPLSRLYYLGQMFRHERPQKGRYRQFSQVGVELIGAAQPAADVELIDVMVQSMQAIGLAGTSLELNSLGCKECRPGYRQKLKDAIEAQRNDLCDDCKRRMVKNPLRVLDCKVEGCRAIAEGAPKIIENLCGDCSQHFGQVRQGIETLDITYNINHRMVRGLDYYTRTTFEVLAEGLGAQNAVAAGGRYDDLVKSLGGPEIPAVGFAAGLDRILLKLMSSLAEPIQADGVFVVIRGEDGWLAGLKLMQELRNTGIVVQSDVRSGSMKAQMKRADKSGARFVALLGEDEVLEKNVTVKDMRAAADSTDKQFKLAIDVVVQELLVRLKQQTN